MVNRAEKTWSDRHDKAGVAFVRIATGGSTHYWTLIEETEFEVQTTLASLVCVVCVID